MTVTNDTSLIFLLMNPNVSIYLALFIIFYPYIMNYFQNNIVVWFENLFKRYNQKYEIKIEGYHTMKDTINSYDYPEAFIAVCNYINEKNIYEMTYFNTNNNRTSWYNFNSDPEKINYIVETTEEIHIEDEIFIEIDKIQSNNSKGNITINNILMYIRSEKKNLHELQIFIKKCVDLYQKSQKKELKNKLYHFIYQGAIKNSDCVDLSFTSDLISDLSDPNNENNETFDCIFHEHKDNIIRSIDRLNDLAYYKKHGLKRKKGYLFYGKAGCGKTTTTMAIANRYKRHIIEIPLFRVETNLEIENILHKTNINGIDFAKDEILYLFDEIDMAGKCVSKREDSKYSDESDSDSDTDVDKKSKNKSKKHANEELSAEQMFKNMLTNEKTDPNKLSLGTLLSRLDGIGNYSGLIFIATTNYKNKLDYALFRHGRLEPLYFNYASRDDVKNIIEHYYDNSLSNDQILSLPDRILPHSSILKYIEDHENDCDKLVEFLKNATYD